MLDDAPFAAPHRTGKAQHRLCPADEQVRLLVLGGQRRGDELALEHAQTVHHAFQIAACEVREELHRQVVHGKAHGRQLRGAQAPQRPHFVVVVDLQLRRDMARSSGALEIENARLQRGSAAAELRVDVVERRELGDRRNGPDEGSTCATAATINESLNLKDVQGMTNCHAGHAELLNQLSLSG